MSFWKKLYFILAAVFGILGFYSRNIMLGVLAIVFGILGVIAR